MKKRGFYALLLSFCLCVTSLSGCKQPKEQSRNFYLMDTVISVTIYDISEEDVDPIFDQCQKILSELDALWARGQAGSDIAKWNASTDGDVDLDARTVSLLKKAISVTQETDGAFDITVAPLVDLWKQCETENRLPTEEEMAAALISVGSDKLTIEKDQLKKELASVQLDLGAIGKGGAIDLLIAYLESCDLQGGLVSFGSNVAVFGEKTDKTPFKIAIRDPHDQSGVVGSVSLQSGEILSISGDYERYVMIDGEKYHHILSPENGYPAVSGLSTVAVITRDGALADVLSTALFVMGEARAMELYEAETFDFEAVFIHQDGTIVTTENLSGAEF